MIFQELRTHVTFFTVLPKSGPYDDCPSKYESILFAKSRRFKEAKSLNK